jgi:hypothetical protein
MADLADNTTGTAFGPFLFEFLKKFCEKIIKKWKKVVANCEAW